MDINCDEDGGKRRIAAVHHISPGENYNQKHGPKQDSG
jgi:hypothetical protein